MSRIDKSLYASGIRFECTGCGECCRSRHGYGYIYVTLEERRRLAKHLGMKTQVFTRRHCEKTEDRFHLRQPAKDCGFLQGERCMVYQARPQQCRSWPFWPENMSRKVWSQEVKRDCPGIGIGRLYSRQEIEGILAAEKLRDDGA
jgi:Fe-S-cluster containining protein